MPLDLSHVDALVQALQQQPTQTAPVTVNPRLSDAPTKAGTAAKVLTRLVIPALHAGDMATTEMALHAGQNGQGSGVQLGEGNPLMQSRAVRLSMNAAGSVLPILSANHDIHDGHETRALLMAILESAVPAAMIANNLHQRNKIR